MESLYSIAYSIGPFLIMILVFYFLLIKPLQKLQKQRQNMLDNLNVDDKIVTVGGIIGIITEVNEKSVWLEVSEDVEIELKKSGIAAVDNDSDKTLE